MSRRGPYLILDHHGERVRIPLGDGEQSLGRKDCDISIPGGSLSKLHAWITISGDVLEVRDAGSKNGVTVNGRRVEQAALSEGDSFCCGKLRFQVCELASSEASTHGPCLRLVQGGAEKTWWLGADTITVGSKRTNDIVISGEGVSRYHVEVSCQDEAYWLQDLGARNGVVVKGEKITEHPLLPGDEFQLGTCVLRYEIVKPKAVSPVAEILEALKADPVAAFKNDARVRIAAMAVVATLVAMIFLLPGSGTFVGPTSTKQRGPWLANGSDLLLRGTYAEARDVFRKAKVHLPPGEQEVPRTLGRISAMWASLEDRGPEGFRWAKANELILRTAKLKGLGDDLRGWLDFQQAFVETNKKASKTRDEAKALAARARELAHERDLASALEHFQRASARYERVPAASLFGDEARKARDALAKDAFKAVVRSIRNAMLGPQPDWRGLQDRVDSGRVFALTPKSRARLRSLRERCQINSQDEVRFVHAQRLIKTRTPSNYETAQTILEQIDSRSKIHPDAAAYLEWLGADRLVREAGLAYARADGRRAFALLAEAMRSPSLGGSAKESISRRRTHWSRVVHAYDRGMRSSGGTDQELARAEEELQLVLDLEQDPRNLFRTRAKEQLDHLRSGREAQLRRRIQAGLNALKARKYVSAMSSFDAVAHDPVHRASDLDRIRNTVAKLNDEINLFRRAKKKLIRDDKGSFLHLRDVFKLLAQWLPTRHPDRRSARKHLHAVVERINVWKASGAWSK